MITRREIYNDYIESVQYRISKTSDKLQKYESTKLYIVKKLTEHREVFSDMGINFDALLSNPLTAYNKVLDFIKNGQLTKVAHYIKAYTRVHRYITLYRLTLDRLNCCVMPYEAYARMLDIANDTIAKTVLQGDIYTFNGSIGKLYIKEVPRTFLFNGKPIVQPVDWGKSNALKQEFIEEGIVPFDSKKAPNGKKWFVRHTNETNYWFWWEGGPIANRKYFRFYPSKFCNYTLSFYKKFIDKCNNIDDILECSRLGNLNKMHALLKFDKTFFINYKN